MDRQRSNDYFKDILDHLLAGCQIIDFDWRYRYVNDAVARHGGKTKEELRGQRMMDVYPGIEDTLMFQQLARCMERRESARMFNEFTYPDGSKGWFDLSIQPIREGLFVLSLDVTEHKRAEQRIETQLECLATLRAIDFTILGTTDLRLALQTILEQTKASLKADIVEVELFDPHTLKLKTVATLGNRTKEIEHIEVRLGEGVSGMAALERRTVTVSDLVNTKLSGPLLSVVAKESGQAVYSTPLIVRGALIGVLNVILRFPFTASEEWLDFFETLAGQTARAIDSSRAYESLQRANLDLTMAYDTTIEGWSQALDLRDQETKGHALRVTDTTLKLARLTGMTEEELVHVRRGALLHDIGKMGIPDAILLKPDKLTDAEWHVMRRHPIYAYELLSPIAYLRPALDIPYCHHEKWDGTGYPRGLKGEQIPVAARLFAVVDVWDALRSRRRYRQAWPEEKVRRYIHASAGKHFDPRAVETFEEMMATGEG